MLFAAAAHRTYINNVPNHTVSNVHEHTHRIPIPSYSHDHAPDPIHGPLNLAPNQIPIRPPLRKLIDLLRAKDAVEAIPVRDDGR